MELLARKGIHMFKPVFIRCFFLLFGSLFSLLASAYPYHWEVNAAPSGWQGVNYPSAKATCFPEGITTADQKFVYLGFVYEREDAG